MQESLFLKCCKRVGKAERMADTRYAFATLAPAGKFLLPALMLLIGQAPLQATIFHVFKNSINPGDGLTWNTAFTEMGSCIESASIGDTIWVGAGVYFISEALKIKSGMKVYGGFSGTESILSERNFEINKAVLWGSNSKLLYFENTDSTTLVDGFSLVNGKTNLDPSFDCFQFPPAYYYCMGGAAYIYSDDVTKPSFANFKNCIFKKNSARYGGAIGLYLDKGDGGLSIEYCEFDTNNSIEDAGAISCSLGKNCTGKILISDSYFHSNYNGYWGTGVIAIYQTSTKSSITITRSTFDSNFTYLGPGVISNSSNGSQKFKVSDCKFINNKTGNNKFEPGTGGVLAGGYFDVDRCLFSNNKAFEGAAFWGGRSEFKNCIFSTNLAYDQGGAIWSGGHTKILNSTFVSNEASVGGAMDLDYSTDTLVNNVFWGNKADSVGNILYVQLLTASPYLKGNYFDVDSCQDIIRNILNQGVIQECDSSNLIGRDLRFRDSLHNDFRLPLCSRTTNAGFDYLNQGVDFLNNPRIVGGKIDIGAIENQDTAISIFATVVDATLPIGQNGSISIDSVFGGWPPYSVLWNAGDTTWQIQNLGAGFYNLSLLDSAGCKSDQVFSIKEIVSVADQMQLNRFRIVPNPLSESAIIDFEDTLIESCLLKIYSSDSHNVKNVKFNNKPFVFDCSGMQSGIYLFEIFNKDGLKLNSGKLLVR